MIQAIAIDDEPLALKIIEYYCAANDKINLVKTFVNQTEALNFLSENKIDLLFLDIHMPQKNGIDFYKNLDILHKPSVIFTTAHTQYAIDGFDVSAVDYLVKPIEQERFEKSVEKFSALAQNLYINNQDYLVIRADYKTQKIVLNDIVYIEGLDDYVQIHFDNKPKLVTRMSMKSILEKLPNNDYIRIHRSYIVPINKVQSYDSKSVYIKEHILPIGETYKAEVNNKLFKS